MSEADIAQYYKNVDATNAKRGRPRSSKLSEEDKRKRQRAANKKWREKNGVKNLHVGREEFDALTGYAESLSEELGFTVNYRQALLHLLKQLKK